MILAVDTNILLDILIPNTAYLQPSLSCLLSIGQDDELTICEAVYAELGSQFLSSQDLNRFLHDTAIRLVSSNEKYKLLLLKEDQATLLISIEMIRN